MAPLLLPLLLGATTLRQSELAAPSALLVDLMHRQPPPLLLVTASARPSFSFLSGSSVMTHYRIAVTDLAGSVGWDSGRTEAPAAAHIPCGANLTAGASYSWTAEYWDDAGHHSPRATGASPRDTAKSGRTTSPRATKPGERDRFADPRHRRARLNNNI